MDFEIPLSVLESNDIANFVPSLMNTAAWRSGAGGSSNELNTTSERVAL
jgi:hypothetical protein